MEIPASGGTVRGNLIIQKPENCGTTDSLLTFTHKGCFHCDLTIDMVVKNFCTFYMYNLPPFDSFECEFLYYFLYSLSECQNMCHKCISNATHYYVHRLKRLDMKESISLDPESAHLAALHIKNMERLDLIHTQYSQKALYCASKYNEGHAQDAANVEEFEKDQSELLECTIRMIIELFFSTAAKIYLARRVINPESIKQNESPFVEMAREIFEGGLTTERVNSLNKRACEKISNLAVKNLHEANVAKYLTVGDTMSSEERSKLLDSKTLYTPPSLKYFAMDILTYSVYLFLQPDCVLAMLQLNKSNFNSNPINNALKKTEQTSMETEYQGKDQEKDQEKGETDRPKKRALEDEDDDNDGNTPLNWFIDMRPENDVQEAAQNDKAVKKCQQVIEHRIDLFKRISTMIEDILAKY